MAKPKVHERMKAAFSPSISPTTQSTACFDEFVSESDGETESFVGRDVHIDDNPQQHSEQSVAGGAGDGSESDWDQFLNTVELEDHLNLMSESESSTEPDLEPIEESRLLVGQKWRRPKSFANLDQVDGSDSE